MNDRFVTALTRRASLMAISGVGMAALAQPLAAKAKKKHRKRKGDVNKLCKTQVEPCISLLTELCGSDVVCKAAMRRCCPFYGTCDVIGAQLCFTKALP